MPPTLDSFQYPAIISKQTLNVPFATITHFIKRLIPSSKPKAFCILRRNLFDDGHNLSTIKEDFEPLLPEPDSPGSTRTGRLSEDPAIAKHLVDEEDTSDDRRHSTKIPTDTLEASTNNNETNDSLRLELIQTLFELQITLNDLKKTRSDFDTYRDWAETQLDHREYTLAALEGQIESLSPLYRKKRFRQLLDGVQVKQDIIDAQGRDIEGKETIILWLEEDIRKLERVNAALERKAGILWEEGQRLKKKRMQGGEEDPVFFI